MEDVLSEYMIGAGVIAFGYCVSALISNIDVYGETLKRIQREGADSVRHDLENQEKTEHLFGMSFTRPGMHLALRNYDRRMK